SALPLSVRLLTGAFLLLILAQLIPLPPSIWHGLPGCAPLVDGFAAAGMPDRWWPFSIDPLTTAWSLITLVPPLLALAAMSALPKAQRPAVVLALVACGTISALLQGVQLIADDFYLHPRSIDAGPGGLIANQNSQADFLVIALWGW
ncbi:MAG: hypothetical protein IPL18_12035, partial [Sphingomonadales bacterium]|nr:hypothetical protein [Sphingomonadales bacterium]